MFHQVLQLLKRFYNKHFGHGEEDDADELAQAASNDLKFFGLLEEEMQALTKIFTSLHFVVGSHDALAKIKSRLRVAMEGEKVEDDEEAAVVLVVAEDELVEKVEALRNDLEALEAERKRVLSSYRFLKNNDDDGSDCTICYETLGVNDIAILPCLHRFHFHCHSEWEKRSNEPQCAMCRAPAPKKDVQRIRNNEIEVKTRIEHAPKAKPVDSVLASLQERGMSTKMTALITELKICAAWKVRGVVVCAC